MRSTTPVLCALLISFLGCTHSSQSHQPGVIVLGIDGMDPNFVERHWQELPNLASLRDRGTFQRLATTTPPQSPVAWSTFITGLEPAEHEIFDFVHRDPATLQPFSSMAVTSPASRVLPLGPYLLPLSSARVTANRQGEPFWQKLSKIGVPVEVMRMPTNYPPVEAGHALAGMGMPDLLGTLGTFTFFTDDFDQTSQPLPGGRIVKTTVDGGRAILRVEGPANTLRRDQRVTSANLIVDIDRENPVLRIKSGERMEVLNEGEWSNWLPVEFELIPHISTVKGMVRVFVKQVHPKFEMYVSPINVDPVDPAVPFSTPAGWSRAVAGEVGRFTTLGIPEDTSALRQNVLTLDQFRQQSNFVFKEERDLLRYSLRHFQGGLLFFYFSSIDQNSHILWGRHEAELLAVYKEVDSCIGEAMRAAPNAKLIVMSDHGFSTFDRAVNLNTWLKDRGFLAGNGDFGSIDWASTEAYALGLNGLYINLKGRERQGIVASSQQRDALVANLCAQLLAWQDPKNGRHVVEAVAELKKTAHNSRVSPDLIVGYAPGFRGSWQTGLGETPLEEIEDNNDLWIGDHCINPADVPGVLFTSWKSDLKAPRLQDVTGLILRLF